MRLNRYTVKYCLLLIFVIVGFHNAVSQKKDNMPFVLKQTFKHYTQEDGLSSNECHHIFEDDRGYLWICTDEGLSRFDGREFRHYGVNEGLTDPFVVRIKKMKSGRAIGWTFDGNLFELKGDVIEQIPTNKDIYQVRRQANLITDVVEHENGSLLISTSEGRGYILRDSLGILHFIDSKHADTDRIVFNFTKLKGQLFSYLSSAPGTQDSFGINFNNELKFYNNRKTINFNTKPLIYKGVMYHCSTDHLYKYDGEELVIVDTEHSPWNLSIVDGKLWLASQKRGIYEYDLETLKPTGKSILKDFYCTSLFRDSGNVYWVSSLKEGLIRFQESTPFILTHPSLDNLSFGDIESNGRDNIKLTGRTEALYASDLFDINLSAMRKLTYITSSVYSHVDVLYHKDFDRYLFQKRFRTAENIVENKIFEIDSSLNLADITTQFINNNPSNELINEDIIKYAQVLVKGDSVYFSNSGFISLMYRGKFALISEEYPELKTDIRALAFYNDGLLVGTKSKGLLYLKDKVIYVFDESDGLLSNHVSSIEPVGEEVLLGTNKGIMQLSFGENHSITEIRALNRFSGLVETDITSLCYTKDTLWTLSANYVQGIPMSYFSIEESGREKVVLQELVANDKSIDMVQDVVLPANTTKILFQIRKIDFTQRKNVEIYLKLEDIDAEWTKSQIGALQYSNLAAGHYKLKIATDLAQINDGSYEEFQFSIAKALVEKAWFRILLLLMIAGVGIQSLKWFKMKRIRKEGRLDHLKRLKMKALMAQINPHFTFNVLNSIQGLILQNDKIEAVEKLSDFSDLVRKLLEVTDKSFVTVKADLDILIMYIEFEQLRMDNAFEYNLHVDASVLDCHVPPLIFQPIVENAIWHGIRKKKLTNGVINIELKDEIDRIHFIVRDNGEKQQNTKKEKSKEKARTSIGIDLVKERIRLTNGKNKNADRFIMESNESGTSVSFYLMKN